jgi:uncharacterized protein
MPPRARAATGPRGRDRARTGRAAPPAAIWLGITALALLPAAARATDVPPLRAHVNDHAQLLPRERAEALEARLAAYEQRTGQQFALLTMSTLGGDPIEDFSIRAAEQWKLGRKGQDDGLILLIVPNDRAMRIEVGYGLEGAVPDAIASRVIREVLAPAFRQGDFAGGIDSAFGALMHAASGGAEGDTPPPPPQRAARRRAPAIFGFLPFLAFVLFALLGGGRRGHRRRRDGFWIGPAIGGGFGGGGFRGGGFGGGFGGGGGGFGGGGGGFGGGGASGSW